MIFAQTEELMTTGQLLTVLIVMAGIVILVVTAGFLYFKKFGKRATLREKEKAIRMEESGERPPIDR